MIRIQNAWNKQTDESDSELFSYRLKKVTFWMFKNFNKDYRSFYYFTPSQLLQSCRVYFKGHLFVKISNNKVLNFNYVFNYGQWTTAIIVLVYIFLALNFDYLLVELWDLYNTVMVEKTKIEEDFSALFVWEM